MEGKIKYWDESGKFTNDGLFVLKEFAESHQCPLCGSTAWKTTDRLHGLAATMLSEIGYGALFFPRRLACRPD